MIVADGKGDEIIDGINILDVGKSKTRLQRMLITTNKIYKKALQLNADVYHFHDPELIPIGLRLIKKGKKVIYDVHEDVPRQLLSKPYLNKTTLKIISNIFKKYEEKNAKKFSAIITVVPEITQRLGEINKKTIEVRNYPMLSEFPFINTNWQDREDAMVYIGGISEIRGINEMLQIAYHSQIKLHLAGPFSPPELENKIKTKEEWKYVIYHGVLNRKEIVNLLLSVKLGLLLLHPVPNHIIGLNTKVFEYLAAGIPVITSDLPNYKNIIIDNNCGFCIDIFDTNEIVEKVKYIFMHDREAEMMGQSGRKAVETIYNWENEEKKLIELYENIILTDEFAL
jgi:glycosyltransferase involved in cell wall biosynthesis